MTQCFGYVRVSTLKQGDGTSLEAQKDAITGFASHNGLVIKEWFEELETASKRGRPVFDKMMKRLQGNEAQGVIVHRWDRSARNFTDWAKIGELSDRGIKVFCAGDNIDFESRSGRLMADIQMVLATDYSRNLSIEVRKGQTQRLKQGQWPWRAPLGYVNNGEGALKTPCPKKAPLVKELFRLYLTEGYSFATLTETMAARGLKNLDDRPLGQRQVELALRNPFYCGQLSCKYGLFKGAHKSLITVAQFRAIQLIKAKRCVKRVSKHDYIFRGVFRCATCGKAAIGERQKGRVYYRCHTKGCPEPSCREDRLEAAVCKALERIVWSDQQIEGFREDLGRRDLVADRNDLENSLNLRAAEVQTRKSRLTDLLLDGSISDAEFQMRKKQYALELAGIDEERKKADAAKVKEGTFEDLVNFVSNLLATWEAANNHERRRILTRLFERMQTKGGEATLYAATWVTDPFANTQGRLGVKGVANGPRDAKVTTTAQ